MVYIKMKHFDFKEFSTFLNQGGGTGGDIHYLQHSKFCVEYTQLWQTMNWIVFFYDFPLRLQKGAMMVMQT